MAVNDAFAEVNESVLVDNEWIVDGSAAETGAANITELTGNRDADIYREYDPAGDGSYAVTNRIDEKVGQWHSQGNDLVVSTAEGVRLRIVNRGNSDGSFAVTGYEVDN